MVCAIKYKAVTYKNQWCRGLVEEVFQEEVQVFLVDIGHRRTLPMTTICELPPRYFDIVTHL